MKELQKSKIHMKSDERILGDSNFVSEMLSKAEESSGPHYALKANRMDIDFIAKRVATLLEIPVEEVWGESKFKNFVQARSLLCFWAVRELGVSMAPMARRLNISSVAVSTVSNYIKLIS